MAPNRPKEPTKPRAQVGRGSQEGLRQPNQRHVSSADDSTSSESEEQAAAGQASDIFELILADIPDEVKSNLKKKADEENNGYFGGGRYTIVVDELWDRLASSARKRRSVFMAKCGKCEATVMAKKRSLSQHYVLKHSNKTTNTSGSSSAPLPHPLGATSENSVKSPNEEISREEIAIAQGHAGINDTQLETFFRVLNGAMHATVVPELSRKALARARDELFNLHVQHIAKLAKTVPFVTISLDGGTIRHIGIRVMIVILYLGRKSFLLPPMYRVNRATIDASHYTKGIRKSLATFGISADRVRWIVADGAKTNTCAERGMMQVLSDRLCDDEDSDTDDAGAPAEDAATPLVDDPTLAMNSAEEDQAFMTAASNSARECNRQASFIRCPPHIIKLWIERATPEDWSKTPASRLVTNFSQLISASDTVRRRFKAFVNESKAQPQQIRSLMEMLLNSLSPLTVVADPFLRCVLWKEVKDAFADATVQVHLGHFAERVNVMAAATPQDLPDDEQEVAANMSATLHKVMSQPHAAFATKNNMRYHNSTFGAYLYCQQNLQYIFKSSDVMNGTSKSCQALQSLADQQDEITAQLLDYISVFKPVADLMETVSDVSRDHPRAVHVYGNLQACKVALQKILSDCDRVKEDAPVIRFGGMLFRKKVATALLKEIGDSSSPPWNFYEAVSIFHPGIAAPTMRNITNSAKQSATDMVARGELSEKGIESMMRRAVHNKAAQIADVLINGSSAAFKAELAAYLTTCGELQRQSAIWWESEDAAQRYPLVAPLARNVIWVPSAVTRCDSALSVASSHLKPNVAHLNAEGFARRLMLSCNGDVTESNDVAKTFFGDTMKKRLRARESAASSGSTTPRDEQEY